MVAFSRHHIKCWCYYDWLYQGQERDDGPQWFSAVVCPFGRVNGLKGRKWNWKKWRRQEVIFVRKQTTRKC